MFKSCVGIYGQSKYELQQNALISYPNERG